MLFIINDTDRNALLMVALIIIILYIHRVDILKRVNTKWNTESAYERNLRLKSFLFDKTPYAVIATDPSGEIVLWNKTAQRKLGWTQEEVLRKNITIIIPDEYKAMHEAGMQRWRDTGESGLIDNETGIELMALHKNGHTFPIHLKLISINDDGFKTVGGYIRNITKEKEERRDVMARLVFLERTEKLADVGGWHWDTLTDVVTVTTNFRELFNVDDDEQITSKMLMDLVYPADQLELGMAIITAKETKSDYRVNYRRFQANGELALIECRGYIILDDDGEEKGIEGTIRKHDYADGKQFLGQH